MRYDFTKGFLKNAAPMVSVNSVDDAEVEKANREDILDLVDTIEDSKAPEEVQRHITKRKKKVSTRTTSTLGVQMVDLGLPSGLRWADRNIGASAPQDNGLYFQFASVNGYKADHRFTNSDVPYLDGQGHYSKYSDADILDEGDDAAFHESNGTRCMPDADDFEELVENTNHTVDTVGGVKGVRFTSKTNGNSIFFPFAGQVTEGRFDGAGHVAFIWSSESYGDGKCAKGLLLDDHGHVNPQEWSDRFVGYTIRAVENN